MIRVTYQKKNGEIIERYSTVSAPYKIGQTNGFGWKVINKEYSFNNKYYTASEYDNQLLKWDKKDKRKRILKEHFNRLIKETGHIIILIVLYKNLEFILKF